MAESVAVSTRASQRPALELADVFREHAGKLANLPRAHAKVIRDIVRCRTEALGGHVLECDQCGHIEHSYNSCRNRHCPKCQGLVRKRWIEHRMEDVLPVPYFHVVFTLPDILGPLALRNKRLVYDLLFRSSADTLREVAENPKRLGAKIGFISVLHTWTQTLQHHPHIHSIVAGGGLSEDETSWIPSRDDFFLPVWVLSDVFRGKFIHGLKRAYRKGTLRFPGEIAGLADRVRFRQLLRVACTSRWVVYSKRPFAGPEQVIRYLGRYTHGVAISNHRLVRMDEDSVTFRWKDRRAGNAEKTMTLDALEFMRRFLFHVLPKGFVRIRHYGFLSSRNRKRVLPLVRRLLGQKEDAPHEDELAAGLDGDDCLERDGERQRTCPQCKTGTLVVKELIPPSGDG